MPCRWSGERYKVAVDESGESADSVAVSAGNATAPFNGFLRDGVRAPLFLASEECRNLINTESLGVFQPLSAQRE